MPRQIILLEKNGTKYQVAFWLTPPSALQPKLANPEARSSFRGASPSEVADLRSGAKYEVVRTLSAAGLSQAQFDTTCQNTYTALQNELNTNPVWTDYGRSYDGVSWASGTTPPVPMRSRDPDTFPTFFATTPMSAFGANKVHFVAYNGSTYHEVRILLVVVQPGTATVTGVAPSEWTLRRRLSATTLPSGGAITSVPVYSIDTLPSGITFYSAPTTTPAGGTLQTFVNFMAQADEIKLSSLDGPTFASLQPFAGAPVYDASRFRPAMPLILRPGEILEIVQSATAGTGNARVLCVFAVNEVI